MENFDLKKLNAKEYLEYLQTVGIFEIGLPIDSGRLNIDKAVDEWCKKLPHLKNKEEELKNDFKVLRKHEGKTIFEEFVDITLPLLDKKDRENLIKIPKGNLPLLDPNAAAMKIPSGGILLIFNLSIITLIHSFIEIVLAYVYRHIDDNKLFMYCILNGLWHATDCREGRLKDFIIPDSDPAAWGTAEVLTAIAEYFVAVHEISHVVLGHLDESSVTHLPCLPKKNEHEPSFLLRRHSQEFQSDQKAVELVLKALSESPNFNFPDFKSGAAIAGVDIFFTILKFLEIFWKKHDITISTHPNAQDRREKLRSKFWKNFKEADKICIKLFEGLFDSVCQNIEKNEISFNNPNSIPCDSCTWPILKENSLTCHECNSYLCRKCIRFHMFKYGHNTFTQWGLCPKCENESSRNYVNLTNVWTPYNFNEPFAYKLNKTFVCDRCLSKR